MNPSARSLASAISKIYMGTPLEPGRELTASVNRNYLIGHNVDVEEILSALKEVSTEKGFDFTFTHSVNYNLDLHRFEDQFSWKVTGS